MQGADASDDEHPEGRSTWASREQRAAWDQRASVARRRKEALETEHARTHTQRAKLRQDRERITEQIELAGLEESHARQQKETTANEVRELAIEHQALSSKMRTLSDPREGVSKDHWRVLDRIRAVEVRQQKSSAAYQRSSERLDRVASLLNGLSRREARLSDEIASGEREHQRILQRMLGERDRTRRAKSRREISAAPAALNEVADRLQRTSPDQGLEEDLSRASLYIRNALAHDGNSYVESFKGRRGDLRSFGSDADRLRGDQEELRVDSLVAMIRVLAEEHPEVMLEVATHLLASERPVSPRVRFALAEIFRALASRLSAS